MTTSLAALLVGASLAVSSLAMSQPARAPVQTAGWTWTLYEGEGPVVLANEIPDTPRLRATFECTPGSGVARVSAYGGPLSPGFASITSGSGASAVQAHSQAEAGRGGKITLALRTDHPVFGEFVTTGDLDVTTGGQRQTVTVEAPHLAKLRRFADLCSG